MKTRIVHTKFWQDGYVSDLSVKEKIAFLYLLTNERANICAAYELSERSMSFSTGLSLSEVEAAKRKFENAERFLFFDGWVLIVNAEKYNNYRFSQMNEKAYQRELALIPEHVRQFFGLEVDPAYKPISEYKKSNGKYQHRKLAEKYLGRSLEPNEVVHHIDRDPSNNGVENLAVMSEETHRLLHKEEIDLKDTRVILVSHYSATSAIHPEIRNKKEGDVKGKQSPKELRKEGMGRVVEKITEWQEDWPELNVREEIAAAYDWLRSENQFKSDYVAYAKNWLRRSAKQKEGKQYGKS